MPSGTQLWDWSELDPDGVHEVAGPQRAEAETLLRDVPIVVLSEQQAAEFIGEPLPHMVGTRACLTRGLILNRDTGGFTVYVSGDQLVVYHRSLGRGAVTMTRQPLVLQLEQEPSDIYVACSMAE